MLRKISCGLMLCPLFLSINPQKMQANSLQTSRPIIVSSKLIKPKKIVYKKEKFTPWSEPTVSQVFNIIRYESNKWGVSYYALANRIRCESTYIWWKTNGQYRGLGQFAPSTFARGMGSIDNRKIIMNKKKVIKKRVRKQYAWSDGTYTYANKWFIRQAIITRYIGIIPRYPRDIRHGWAQIRLVARAMAGLGAVKNSEWECR